MDIWSNGDEPQKLYAESREARQKVRVTYCVILFAENVRIGKSVEAAGWLLSGGKVAVHRLMGTGFYFGEMKMFWNYMRVILTLVLLSCLL